MESKTLLECINKQAENQSLGLVITLLIEEMAELTQALSKLQRNMKFDETCRTTNEEARKGILEEIADVEIMLQKLEYKLNMHDVLIIEQIKTKIERTEKLKEQKETNNKRALERYKEAQQRYSIKDKTLRKYSYIKHRVEKVINEQDEEIKKKLISLPYIKEMFEHDKLMSANKLITFTNIVKTSVSYLYHGEDARGSDVYDKFALERYIEFKKEYDKQQRNLCEIVRRYVILSLSGREELKRRFPYLPVNTNLIDDDIITTIEELVNEIKHNGIVQEIYDYMKELK